ncbi:MAG: YihY/virulence factor BrkB family protein [Thermoleophilia bacterium]
MKIQLDRLPWPLGTVLIVLADSIGRFQRHRCTTAAAAIAFHVLFSIFPLVLLITVVVGSRTRSTEVRSAIADGLMNALPLDPSARGQIDNLLLAANANLAAIGIIGALALVWSASGMLGSVRGAMELAWEGFSGTRPFVRGKLVDAVLLTILVTVILSSFLIGVLLSFVPQIPRDALGATGFWHDAAAIIRTWIGPAVSLLTTIVVMLLTYKFLPKPRPAFRYALAGAVIAGILFEVTRRVFTIYLEKIARYDLVYGSIGSIIASLFFVYIASMILLFGAELGASIRRVHNVGRLLPRRKAEPDAT